MEVKALDNGRLVGDFEFYASPTIYDPLDFTPRKKISFGLSMKLKQDLQARGRPTLSQDEIFEMIGQKLKEDFIKALKEGFKNDPTYPEKEYRQ